MKKNIVVIDNYDSFTYNLVHHIQEITGHEIDIFRNDAVEVKDLDKYDYIFISPGPGLPEDSGITLSVISEYHSKKNIFGVCLGLQSIVVALGGELLNLERVYHGIESEISQIETESPIFDSISQTFKAGRYHSWVADIGKLPAELEVTCKDQNGQIMGIQHRDYPVYAVQFHPESIMTPDGMKMIENFLNLPIQ